MSFGMTGQAAYNNSLAVEVASRIGLYKAAHACILRIQSIVSRYHASCEEYMVVAGHSDDDFEFAEEEEENVLQERADITTEAQWIHCAECQSLHDEYSWLVGFLMTTEPGIIGILNVYGDSVILVPLDGVLREDLTTMPTCDFFFY